MADKLALRGRPNQFHDWLHGVQKRPGSRAAPADPILNLWAQRIGAGEIRRTVLRPDGQMYAIRTIEAVIERARDVGDPRAIYHNTARPA